MFRLIARLTAFACLFSCLPLHAQEEALVEEIVVTGEFRAATVDQMAGSVSVLQPDRGGQVVNHLEEILGRAANVNYASGASRGRYIQIRGVGERGQFIEPLNPSVGLVVDGVDLSGVGTAATLFDVEQVEIFRGPQGTLYGANALAGLINVVTYDPADEFTTAVRLDGADYGTSGLGAVVSGPLGRDVGFRLAANRHVADGFIRNSYLNRDDTNDLDELTLRGKLRWQGENADWTLSAGRIDIDNGYDAFSLDNDRNTRSDQPGRDVQESRFGSVKVDWHLLNAVTLEARVGYVANDIEYGYDEDWTFVGFHPWEYSSTDFYARDIETLTAEARLVSSPDQGLFDGAVDWVLGLYTLRQDVELRRKYTFLAEDFRSDFSVDRVALYGELARDLTEDIRLTVGGRIERHEAQYNDSASVAYNPDDDLFGGRVLLEKRFADRGFVYAGITKGYKTGGFNADGSLDTDLREYQDEGLWNFELGYKGQLVRDRFSLRAALFRMERDNVQIATSIVRVRADGSSEFIEYVGNAAEGHNQGLELELTWRATENLSYFVNLGFLDTEFSDYTAVGGPVLDGRDQAHAPKYQFYVSSEYLFGDGWFWTVEAEGKDEFFFSDSHDQVSDSYVLLHTALGYETQRWGARLWMRNIADRDYFVRGFYFPNDPRDFYETRLWTQLGAPRQIGVSVQARF